MMQVPISRKGGIFVHSVLCTFAKIDSERPTTTFSRGSHHRLDHIINEAASKSKLPCTLDDGHEPAMGLWDQAKIVSERNNFSLFRNIDYINNIPVPTAPRSL